MCYHLNHSPISLLYLIRSGLQSLSNNAKMHYNWANYLKDINQTIKAESHYREAIRWDLHYEIFVVYSLTATTINLEESIFSCYRISLTIFLHRLWPSYASAYNNLGTIMSHPSHAEYFYRQAIQLNTNHAGAFFNLGALQMWVCLQRVFILDPTCSMIVL